MVDNKSPINQAVSKVAGKGVPTMAARPRRFSLIYSSDSSLSDVSDDDKNFNNQNKGKKSSNNSYGKQSKLIQGRPQISKPTDNELGDESTESSDYGVIDDDDNDSSDDDDDDDDDSDSEISSSDDENIDFVKLSAQRKKKVMQAFTKLKRGKTAADVINEKEKKDQMKSAKIEDKNSSVSSKPQLNETNKNKSTSLNKMGSPKTGSEEDIGEEISDLKDTNNDASIISNIEDTVDPLHAPVFSESEESDYNIDQDTYFTAINNDEDSIGEIDTGLETGEDDVPILEAEEQNIVKELQEDDNLSFNGSVHEDGPDPVDSLGPQLITNKYMDDEDDYDEDDDEIMSDFDMPFYEDPKFSNLYYYEDGREPKLSLSTSLPLILNEEKKNRLQKREAKKRERQERIQTRKQLRKNAMTNRSLNIDGDEYSFGAFFHSDHEEEEEEIDKKVAESKDKSLIEKSQQNKEKRSTLFGHSEYNSSDSDFDNILLENAHMPSDNESQKSSGLKPGASVSEKIENILDLESDIDIDDLDDEGSMTNVFIDIDDLDPDSFYFHYSDDDSSYTHSSSETTESKNKDSVVETVIYVDDESTDEDDNIPPPEQRKKNIGTNAKEIVSSNTVGLRPPKLGTWETDNKPFSIIDGLSTKSLYTLIQDHQQLHDQQAQKNIVGTLKDGTVIPNNENASPAEEEITLNELLNMSDMDEGSDDNNNYNNNETVITSDWYNKPKVPLSAFRNKGVDMYDEDEYMLPSLSRRKVPIGYVGGERTRKKIDKMKELQRKRTEKKRMLKRKRKILKIQREKARVEKEKSILDSHPHDSTTSLEQSMGDDKLQLIDNLQLPDHEFTETPSRKNSVKSVGIDEIHEILGKDDSNLLDDTHDPLGYVNGLDHTDILMPDSDANIIASLTAPVDFDDYDNGSTSLWKQRRQSMAEAAAENLRFTKNGLFSESALADIEGILNNGNPSSAFEFNEVLQ